MTDKLPRRSGGDGDEPAETPTERLLREAMGARAAQVTAHSLRPAAPPKSRIRRLRPVYTVAVPLGLAAAMALGVLTFHGEPVAHDQVPPPAATLTTSPSPTAEPTATPTPSATPTDTGTGSPTADPEPELPLADSTPSSVATTTNTTPPAAPSTPYTFRGVKFRIPAGWKAVPASSSQVCVLSPGAPTESQQGWSQSKCEPYGVLVAVYNGPDELEGGAWPTMNDLASESGWGHQPNCPIWGRPYFPADGYSSVGAPVRTRPSLAGKTADKTQWKVTCKPGDTFTAQMWGLAPDQVYVVANGIKDDYQAGLQSILNSLDVSGHKAPASTDATVSVTGLKNGLQVPNNETAVPFSVTFKNTGTAKIAGAKALVSLGSYPGTPTDGPMGGTLEIQEGGAWRSMSLRFAGVSAPLEAGVPVDLDPGQSATVNYRLILNAVDGPGTLPLSVKLAVPNGTTGNSTDLATTGYQLQVVAK
ncbi:hypothetical protein GCM10018790_02690 [Kitasatospora xanthocidica]|uniref:hypothetical protein n=1 Tax=Kitasatospora xanthocidica TaxID=83382 RepID=UPI0016766963|nr:hypothetical protein [Kitasatospora xanthocidica]GHF28708.1 hypothetical protein GCM10018790_02690 [Kitasatospora xanthocidica]